MKTLHDFFNHELRTLLSAAEYMHDILKRMSSCATAAEAVELLDTYYYQSQYQAKKIREYESLFSIEIDKDRSFAMRRLSDEGRTNLNYQGSSTIRDIVLLLTVHKMKHYEVASIGTARHHAEVIKAEEGIDLLDTIKKKIAEEELKAIVIIKTLLNAHKAEDLEKEAEMLLGRMLVVHIKEEEKLSRYLEESTRRADSDILQDALQTYREKHKGVSQYLSNARKQFGETIAFSDWEVFANFIKEGDALFNAAKESHLKDLAIVCCVQRIMHQNMALFEVEQVLADFLKGKEMKDHLHTILEHERGNDQSFSSIASGSLLEKGIDSQVQK